MEEYRYDQQLGPVTKRSRSEISRNFDEIQRANAPGKRFRGSVIRWVNRSPAQGFGFLSVDGFAGDVYAVSMSILPQNRMDDLPLNAHCEFCIVASQNPKTKEFQLKAVEILVLTTPPPVSAQPAPALPAPRRRSRYSAPPANVYAPTLMVRQRSREVNRYAPPPPPPPPPFQPPPQRFQGTITRWILSARDQYSYGFIHCRDMPDDVLVRNYEVVHMPRNNELEVGTPVDFGLRRGKNGEWEASDTHIVRPVYRENEYAMPPPPPPQRYDPPTAAPARYQEYAPSRAHEEEDRFLATVDRTRRYRGKVQKWITDPPGRNFGFITPFDKELLGSNAGELALFATGVVPGKGRMGHKFLEPGNLVEFSLGNALNPKTGRWQLKACEIVESEFFEDDEAPAAEQQQDQ